MIRPLGSTAGTYFVVVQDFDDWLVVGVAVAGGDGWVAGRWDSRELAVADAERWTQLAAAVSGGRG